MKQLIIVMFLVSAFTYSCKEESREGSIKIVTADEMKELSQLDDVQLLDVRTPEEYAVGYIDGFQNIDFLSESFQDDIEKLDKNKPVIVYCKSGGRSGRCSKLMLEKGFKKIYDLEGGITKWESEGNAVVNDSQ
ncbi:MAG: rhodanese-like domain-containing protein [Bacteroidetes bacterium]|nr:MAG: rhodanese-like domain-containing protein [Bacteroidota bacterium]